MKTFLIGLVLTIFCIQGYAQLVFAPAGAIWHFGATPYDFWYGVAVAAPPSGGLSCASINMYEYHVGYPPSARGSINICESPNGDTVYYWRGGKRVPLYIFNVSAGDTVAFSNTNYSNPDSLFRVRIDSVKPQLWGNSMLLTVWGQTIGLTRLDPGWCSFALDTGSQVLYVERLGAVNGNGLLPWTRGVIPESPGGVTCYYDGTTDMRRYSYDSCYGVPVAVLSQSVRDCRIYPNPVIDYCTIKFARPLATEALLFVYDVCGRLRNSAQLSASQTRARIDMKDWPSGVYILEIAAGGVSWHTRMAKQ